MDERLGQALEREFLQYCWLIGKHPGNRRKQQAAAERFKVASPNLDRVLKANEIPVATATTSGWASQLSDWYTLTGPWVTATSKKTFLLGSLPYVRAPFQTRILSSSVAGVGYVAGGKGIPLQALALDDTATLDALKLGVIIAVDDELFEHWRPGTRENLDAILTLGVVRGLDAAVLDPERAAIVGERPASILNGVAPLGVLGSTVATVLPQIKSMLEVLVAGGSDLGSAVFVGHPSDMLTLSTLVTTEGVPAFPQLGATGGSILGIPAVTSVGAVRSGSPSERVFACVDGAQILVADDGAVEIMASKVASLQMESAPTMDGTGSTTPTATTSLFQTASTALKVIRWINFQRVADSAVAWLTVGA